MRSAKQLAVAGSLAFLALCDSSAMASAKPKPDDRDKESSALAVPSALTRTEAIVRLIAELKPPLAEGAVRKIAVLDLTDLDGNCSALGRFLAEELTTGLSRGGGIEVVERNRLRQVLADLNEFTAPEPETYKTLQQSLGVDAALVGTLTPLGGTTKINVRVIATDTGRVVTAGAQEFGMDEPLTRLLNTPCRKPAVAVSGTAPANVAVAPNQASSSDGAAGVGEVFFREDFARYETGDPVVIWGTNVIATRWRDGRSWLTSIVPGEHLVSRDVQFPPDFSFEYECSDFPGASQYQIVFVDSNANELGVTIGESFGWYAQLPGTQPARTERKEISKIRIVRKDNVVKVYINGVFLVSGVYAQYKDFVNFKLQIRANSIFTGFVGKRL